MKTIHLSPCERVYFASDQHFGAPNVQLSKSREQLFVSWLNQVEKDAKAIFLLGDLFDFWFEYKSVIPKGFVRVLGKLAELSDKGIKIYFFVGNHDLWMSDYFSSELNVEVFHSPQRFTIDGKTFFIGHGDGLGPGDRGYKRLKKVFTNPLSKWLFSWLHPDIGVALGRYFSLKNKTISGQENKAYLGEKEWLTQYCKRKLSVEHFDYFIFGHRHLPMNVSLNKTSRYINTGEWLTYFTYAYFDGGQVSLCQYYDRLI